MSKKFFSIFLSLTLCMGELLFASSPTTAAPGEGKTKTETKTMDYDTWNSSMKDMGAHTTLKAPLLNLFETTQWNLFVKEFELTLDFDWCCKKDNPLTCAIGIKAHMIEPIGYMETTKKPLYFPFANLDLGGNIIKGGYQYEFTENGTPRDVVYDAHFIYVPIMGMLFKKTLSFVCFHDGDLIIPYLSEFDPTWKMDIYGMKMLPHMIFLFTPQGLVNSIVDCVATEIVNTMMLTYGGNMDKTKVSTGTVAPTFTKDTITTFDPSTKNKGNRIVGNYSSKLRDGLNGIRDSAYHVDGCNGFSPVGGYVSGHDVILDATLMFHGIMAMLHGASALSPVPFLSKQTNMFIDNTSLPNPATAATPEQAEAYQTKVNNAKLLNTMCTWKDYPLPIPSQYVLQLAYPTTGSAKEVGASGLTVSTAKNLPASYGSAFSVWVRRDYYAFAYFCHKEDKK